MVRKITYKSEMSNVLQLHYSVLSLLVREDHKDICFYFTVAYQTEGKVEQSRATVEQDSNKSGRGGEEEAHVSTHDHPKGLQDLQSDKVLSGSIQTLPELYRISK